MANIIVDDKLNIRTTQFSDQVYSFSDLSFYISDKFNSCSVYLALSDSNSMSDVVPLDYRSCSNGGYKIYTVNYNNKIRIQSGACRMSIILLSDNISNCYMSHSLNINLNIENYLLAHQLCITKEISQNVSNLYEKMIQISQMNIDLFEKMEKEINKT